MPRSTIEQIVGAAHGTLVDGERVTEFGTCWAAQRKPRLPLLFTARRRYLMVLTDRRLLLFTRRRWGRSLQLRDLVLGKRYEAFALTKVRRSFPLSSIQAEAHSGVRMIFEFSPGQRHLRGGLLARLTPAPPIPTDEPALVPGPGAAAETAENAEPAQATEVTGRDGSTGGDPPSEPPAGSGDDEQRFWGPPTRGT